MEGTAAWVEDELYDDVNDNLNLPQVEPAQEPAPPARLRQATCPPTAPGSGGASSAETLPDDERHRPPGHHQADLETSRRLRLRPAQARHVLDRQRPAQALSARSQASPGSTPPSAGPTGTPRTAYSEGGSYPTAPLTASHRLTGAQPQIAEQVATMPHLTNVTVGFRPGPASASAGGWRSGSTVRRRGGAPTPRRPSCTQDGTRRTRTIELNRKGRGDRIVGFGRAVDRSGRADPDQRRHALPLRPGHGLRLLRDPPRRPREVPLQGEGRQAQALSRPPAQPPDSRLSAPSTTVRSVVRHIGGSDACRKRA